MTGHVASLTVRRFGCSNENEAALRDLLAGIRGWILWTLLAWLDVKQRYRRAILGPFWITISMGVMVIALGAIYAGIFKQDVRDFLPYIASGLVIWTLIA